MTFDTVGTDTPAATATSRMVARPWGAALAAVGSGSSDRSASGLMGSQYRLRGPEGPTSKSLSITIDNPCVLLSSSNTRRARGLSEDASFRRDRDCQGMFVRAVPDPTDTARDMPSSIPANESDRRDRRRSVHARGL